MIKKQNIILLVIFIILSYNHGAAQANAEAPSRGYFSLNTGINSFAGFLGVGFEYGFGSRFAGQIGLGSGSWGGKISLGAKYYFSDDKRWAISAAFVRASGFDDFEVEFDEDFLASGNSADPVIFDLNPARAFNVAASYHVYVGRRKANRFLFDFGFASSTELSETYTIKSNHALNEDGKTFVNILRPGGIILGIAFQFGL